MDKVTELLGILRPEALGDDVFTGHSAALGSPTIFGGQLMAQTLNVAARTVHEDRIAHFMQINFLTFGDPGRPLQFDVDVLRDGRSTSQRSISISQDGRALVSAVCSFQQDMPADYEHATAMPLVTDAEALLAGGEGEILFDENPEQPFPFEIVNAPLADATAPESTVWAKSRWQVPADTLTQQMLFAFFSDATILQSALQPHQLDWSEANLSVATMNHSIWFYRPIQVNDWILLHSTSPSTVAGRALSVANAFSRDGDMVATVVQEGILRRRQP